MQIKNKISGAALCLLALTSCMRGQPSEEPPFHLWLDMDDQPRYEAFEESPFFEDGAAMRRPVEGTVARGQEIDPVSENQKNPLPLNQENLAKGKKAYDIYCTPCHGEIGNGKGIIAIRGASLGYVAPSNFHTDMLRLKEDGYFYLSIKNGIRNMGPYGSRITPNERWAVVHYVRALQRSQAANAADLPENKRAALEGK